MKDEYTTSDDGSQEHGVNRTEMAFKTPKVPFPRGTRPPEAFRRPWYMDREYLLGGWTDARVWRSAVG